MSIEDMDDDKVLELAAKIFDFAREGDAPSLTAYLEAGVPVDLTNDRGDTLLMLAAYYGHPAAVSAILAAGADPNLVNGAGQTPLAGAVFKGEVDVLTALIAAGADPDAGSPTARETAITFERTDLIKLFKS